MAINISCDYLLLLPPSTRKRVSGSSSRRVKKYQLPHPDPQTSETLSSKSHWPKVGCVFSLKHEFGQGWDSAAEPDTGHVLPSSSGVELAPQAGDLLLGDV